VVARPLKHQDQKHTSQDPVFNSFKPWTAASNKFISKTGVLYVLRQAFFGLLLFMLALLVVAGWLEVWDIALRLGDAYAVSVIWDVFGPDAYRELGRLLESRGYIYQPVGGVPGGVVVYGDVRPIAEEVVQYGGPITVYTRDFYIPLWEPAGVGVASLAAAQLFTALVSAALLVVAWYVFSRKLLRFPAALLIAALPTAPVLLEAQPSAGQFDKLAVLLGAAALPPTLLVCGLLLSRLRRR
jgi:hypothetical protein